MRVFISTDIEGTAGIVDWEQVRAPGAEYEIGRQAMLDDRSPNLVATLVDDLNAEVTAHLAAVFKRYRGVQIVTDAHIRTAKLLEDTDYPDVARRVPLAPTPVDLSETPGRFRQRAPTIGEHTAEILGELGYDRAAIEGLESRGVI